LHVFQGQTGEICVHVHADLKLYTRNVEVAKDRIPSWPHDKLTVLAEQPSIFYDLMTDVMLEQVC
jgi:hypothetical protein